MVTKVKSLLIDNGILIITVPPLKHNIVGGHVTLWNMGLLLYNLVLAGFDCSQAKCKKYGYNISVIVRNRTTNLPSDLHMDCGDLEKLSNYFPCEFGQNIDGNMVSINW